MRAIPIILEILRESLDWRAIHGKGALFLGRFLARAREAYVKDQIFKSGHVSAIGGNSTEKRCFAPSKKRTRWFAAGCQYS